MYRLKKILIRLSQSYSLDLRALAFMRIGMACVIIADLLIRSGDLTAFYTGDGIWSAAMAGQFAKPGAWSLHSLNDTRAWELILFSLHFLFAVCLLLGYRTRMATLLLWIMTISLHNRNAYILQAGDDLLRLSLFWGLFLPWSAYFSLDAASGRAPHKQKPLANLGYLLMVASVYFFSVHLKAGHEWRIEFSAIYYALSLDQLRLPFAGDWLYQHPHLMTILTRLVFYSELAIPFLILYPSKTGSFRFAAFALIFLLHAGIALTLYVGLFFVISIVTSIGLIPAKIMTTITSQPRHQKSVLRKRKGYLSLAGNAICGSVIVFCLMINLSSLSSFSYELRPEIAYVTNAAKLDQYWGMFSPNILKKDGWFIYEGRDSTGKAWDLQNNTANVDLSKPAHIVNLYKNDRWRKLAENLQSDGCTFLRPMYGKYILKQWNKEHPEKKMATLNLYFMEKENLRDYKTTPVSKKLFCVCNDF